MTIATANIVGSDVCKILGIDAKNVTEITISMKAGEVVKITIQRFSKVDEVLNIVRTIAENYTLMKRDDEAA
jgi:hypothetical protein